MADRSKIPVSRIDGLDEKLKEVSGFDFEGTKAEFTGALPGKANIDLANTTPAQSFINKSMAWCVPDYTAGVSCVIRIRRPRQAYLLRFATAE